MGCKISIIGAGSAVFTLGIITEVCQSKYLKGSTISLMDINPVRLEDAYGLALRCVAESRLPEYLRNALHRGTVAA